METKFIANIMRKYKVNNDRNEFTKRNTKMDFYFKF